MGRSATSKRLSGTAPNQHNPKHENGVVGPGKRIQKQKSNNQLNGHSKSSEKASSTQSLPATPPPPNGYARAPVEGMEHKALNGDLHRVSVSVYDESSSSESFHNDANGNIPQENHRQIDVNATKNPAVHCDAGTFTLMLTVLRSCPLYDTIAILIVLLQIPPTFLSLIHILFATLTFVPPSTSSHSTFTLTGIFEGTLGNPSVATIVAVDLLVLLVWLFLWGSLQDIALDLAQTVIALTLGGGTSGRDAGSNNVLICFGIIGASHFARNGGIKRSGLRALFPPLGTESNDPLSISNHISSKGPHGWIRIVLAVHILTQGVVRYIRDWYVRRERRDNLVSGLGDPEAAKGSISHVEHATSEFIPNTPSVTTSETDATGVLPTANTIDKSLNPKKKRKASAAVRIRQPLWAALASTKIVMAKEYETSRTAAESAGTNATDINNLGNAPFNTEADRIWITHVGFDKVCFDTSYFSPHLYMDPSHGNCEVGETPGMAPSQPFLVRINNTVWQPTRIHQVKGPESSISEMRWRGEILGLAPMSRYECEFVSTIDGSTIFSTSVQTMQTSTADAASAPAVSLSIQRCGRPDSPTTTLKTSIATAEAKLSEERNRQKRERRDQKTKMNATRKEIDRLVGNIASSGGNDDRLRQKVQQSNLHAKQAEEATVLLSDKLKKLEHLPEDDSRDWKYAKSTWQSQKEVHKASRSDLQGAKVGAEREIQSLTAEVAAYQQKRERMQSRINKLNVEYERIIDANAKGFDEAQRKASERAAKEGDRERTETMYVERIHTLGLQIQDMQQTLTALWASIHAIQQAEYLSVQAHAQTQQSPTSSNPNLSLYNVPESNMVNPSYPWNPPPNPLSFSMQNPNSFNSLNSLNGPPQPSHRTRGRSSSMLSNVSGFTQSSIEEPLPLSDVQEMVKPKRQTSDGSGSTSGMSDGHAHSPTGAGFGLRMGNLGTAPLSSAAGSNIPARWSGRLDEK